jgi:hypothetical protein
MCYPPTPEGKARVDALREDITLRCVPAPVTDTLGDSLIARGDDMDLAELSQQISDAELLTRRFVPFGPRPMACDDAKEC